MLAKVYLLNGHALDLDEFATKALLKAVHSKELQNSLLVLQVADITGKLRYTIPMSNVVYIEYT